MKKWTTSFRTGSSLASRYRSNTGVDAPLASSFPTGFPVAHERDLVSRSHAVDREAVHGVLASSAEYVQAEVTVSQVQQVMGDLGCETSAVS